MGNEINDLDKLEVHIIFANLSSPFFAMCKLGSPKLRMASAIILGAYLSLIYVLNIYSLVKLKPQSLK